MDFNNYNCNNSQSRTFCLVNIVNAYSEKTVSSEELIPAFRKAFTKLLITHIIDSDDTLRNFSGKIFEERVAQYKRLNDEFTTLTRQEVYLRIGSSEGFQARHSSACDKERRKGSIHQNTLLKDPEPDHSSLSLRPDEPHFGSPVS